MKISYNWLQTYFAKPLPSPEKLEELFIFRACEVESIDESIGKSGKVTDTILDLKVLPDRAHYALSHRGIADEVFSLTQIPRVAKKPTKIMETTKTKPSIEIQAAGFCRRYVGRYVALNTIGKSPANIEAALNAIGQRTIDAIVDATNYVMFDIGQPLHAFDADKVEGNIVVRAAKKGEKIALLDSAAQAGAREVELTELDHVIADDDGPLAIAGVKGGKRAAITAQTKRLILESANFEPTAVRRTSTKYDLRSESSKRYENEITPELAIEGMNELSALILQAIPDARFGPIVDMYPTKAVQTVIEIDPRYISERLGIEVPLETSRKILEDLGIGITDGPMIDSRTPKTNESPWKLTIPFDRLDLTISDDIVEEVGRIYGYEHVIGVLPPKPEGKIRVLPIYYLCEKIKNILVAQGYSEVSLYSLVAKGEIEAAKPLAKDKAFARMDLSDGMLSCVLRNVLNADLIGLEAVKVFEIGHVFSNAGESIHLAIGAVQVKKVKGLNGKKLITNTVNALGKELGINDLAIGEQMGGKNSVENVMTVEITEKGVVSVCEIGLNELLESYTLPANASYDDLGFGPASTNIYEKISPYPFIVRDIAVFVPESVAADRVWSVIEGGMRSAGSTDEFSAIKLLARHSLFDTFKKDGKVSYAFRMVFQSMERTLTDDEAAKIMESINSVLKGKGWEVR